MKTLQSILLICAMVAAINTVNAQSTKTDKKAAKRTAVKNKIDSVKYTFKANYIIPMGGGGQRLQLEYYDLQISKDTVKAFLPYFGRVYMRAPISTTDNGMKFTSTDFDYDVTEKKGGGWLVIIKLKDTDKANRITINISKEGSATVSTISNYMDSVTYYGDIATGKNI